MGTQFFRGQAQVMAAAAEGTAPVGHGRIVVEIDVFAVAHRAPSVGPPPHAAQFTRDREKHCQKSPP